MNKLQGPRVLSILFTTLLPIPKVVPTSKLVEQIKSKHLLSAHEVSDILLNAFTWIKGLNTHY